MNAIRISPRSASSGARACGPCSESCRRSPGSVGAFILITCEHGGNRIPPKYRALFRNARALLDSHRGYDAGALAMARDLAAALQAPLISSTVSRLLVDLNRSVGHPRSHHEAIRAIAPAL